MNKKLIQKYWIDVGLAITFLLAALTGIVKWPGLLPKLGISYVNLPMLVLTRIHDISGLIMTLLVLVHIIQHWKWMKVMTKNVFKKGAK